VEAGSTRRPPDNRPAARAPPAATAQTRLSALCPAALDNTAQLEPLPVPPAPLVGQKVTRLNT